MDISGTRISFRDCSDNVHETDLAVVRTQDLASGRPWRTFRWHRGQAHYSGWYWAATTGRHVIYESRLELARLLLADFDGGVRGIAAQPFHVAGESNGRTRGHVPDFLLIDDDGLATVVNVKPAERLADPVVAEALAWAGEVFTGRGWRHEIWSGAPAAVLANVRFLAAYRDRGRLEDDVVTRVAAEFCEPVSFADLGRRWPDRSGEVRAAVLHLLWDGVLAADLSRPLSAQTTVERAA